MSREIAIIGVGVYPFGRYPGKTFSDLGTVACRDALRDAGINWKDIQIVVGGIDTWSGISGGHVGNVLEMMLGNTGIPVINVQIGCATGAGALGTLCAMIQSGACDIGLAVGTSVSPQGFLPTLVPVVENPGDLDNLRFKMTGCPNPGFFAMECTRRMHDYGTTERHLAKVRVKASKNGALNPYARYRKVLTEEEVLASPMVCYPLRLFEVCALSDGAAAAIVCSMDFARRHTRKPITFAGWSLATRRWGDVQLGGPHLSNVSIPDGPDFTDAADAARMVYERAGLGPKDVDVFELPDGMSYSELTYMEKVGICEPGEADRLVEEGATEIGGKVPVCPSGGFLSFGESTPAMGIWQACELVWQLRGEAGARQVEDAKVGYAQTVGLFQNNGACILKR